MRVGGKHRQYAEEGEASELMSESYSRRSWKGIAIAFLVIGAVAAIVTLIVIYSGTQSPWTIEGTLTLADVIQGKYSPKTFSSSVWSSGDTFMYMSLGALMSFNVSTNKSEVVVPNSTWGAGIDSFYPSPSGNFVLFPYNKTKQYRYSYNASFGVVTSYNYTPFTLTSIAGGKILQYACWGPAQDNIVYVRDNNIYYLDKFNGTEVQVTTDGEPGLVFNGVPDWVYEEEILSSESAVWWSPNGKRFAFMKFNDSKVGDMHYMHYGNIDEIYPTVIDVKYPKPGFSNPDVSLWVVDTSKPSALLPVNFLDELLKSHPTLASANLSSDHYITQVTWANDNKLAVMWGPRTQNQSFVSLCVETGSSWNCTLDSHEKSSGWLDTRPILFGNDGQIYFILKSHENFKQISLNYAGNPNKTNIITGGNGVEVTDIVYYGNDDIYYIRTPENNKKQEAEKRRLYRLSKISSERKEECLSCIDDCDWATASVSAGGKYYSLTCTSPTAVPTVQLFELASNKLVRMWESNEDLKKKLADQTLCTFKDYEIPVNNSEPKGDKIKMRVFVPKNFSESKRYPALVYVYGGPGSQMVQNTFSVDFGTYLVTNKNFLYIEIDGRGSGFRGDKILFSLYKRLGTVEIQDQITAVRYLLHNKTFVDSNRVGIWGWSYGGYAAAMTLAQGKDYFTCAASVAPVTSWRYYDSVYTERYMLRPQDNEQSYKSSQLMNYVSDFKKKSFLLLHGTADDNVHVQQSMMLTKALNNASVLFDMHMYPDENHSIPKSKLHVYMTLEEFFTDCFS